ncbi:MAG: S41 family peptidase [Bacteroidales bacterium]|nr:S41 family peptidase [Bacteroidales bacterium]
MKKYIEPLLIALMGVLTGVLICLLFTKVSERNNARRNWEYGNWRKLSLVLDYVNRHYVDTVDAAKVTDAAIAAALQELDPHSVYLPPVELEESETELAGNFEGIGIQFNVPNDTAIVLSVIPGGPSEKAGLMQGDRILKVDERRIAGVKTPQDSMVRLMKGPSGTKVKITVLRGEESIPFDITRGRIPVNCIDAAFMVNDTTAYVKLSKFTRTTYIEFAKAAAGLLEEGMTKLIFDLRGNTGGFLDQAYLLSNEFLARGDQVVYMEGLHYPRKDFRADGNGVLKDIRLCVLIDESSASASEIFAGAMQDNDRGVVIGRRSFGKGLVQEPLNFTDGSGIKLTIARYYTPSGRCIQKPYGDDYAYDIYSRYEHGEMTEADSIKVDENELFYTVGGRKVYGGGGIIPDVFVPMDTTRASNFFIQCGKKATSMRFASAYFDGHREELAAIGSYQELMKYLSASDIERAFLRFALLKDGLAPSDAEWKETRSYMMPQVNALVGRYSKLGEEAFYRLYMDMDKCIVAAIEQ